MPTFSVELAVDVATAEDLDTALILIGPAMPAHVTIDLWERNVIGHGGAAPTP